MLSLLWLGGGGGPCCNHVLPLSSELLPCVAQQQEAVKALQKGEERAGKNGWKPSAWTSGQVVQ